MKQHEKQALLTYLEFNLTSMVEGFEIALKHTHPEVIEQIVGLFYDGAYEVLEEMERTLTEVDELTETPN